MRDSFLRARSMAMLVAAVCCLSVGLICAQDWKASDSLPGIDFSGLSAAQKATVLKILREQDCSCGCGMKMAQCRMLDPKCSYSRGLASVIIEAIKNGKSENDAIAAAMSSHYAQAPRRQLLEDPISIPVGGAPVLGSQNAPVTLVEFSDFQCPYCAQAAPELEALVKTYPAQAKLIFKQFPLEMHSRAALAAVAAVAAQRQGKFWAMHDAMFAARDDLSKENIIALAERNGLDVKRFEADLDSVEVQEAVTRDIQDGDRAGVSGTPTLFIDGQHYNGPIDVETLRPIIEAELKRPAISAQPTAKP